VVADARHALRWRFDGESAATDELAPGLHVVTERTPDGRDPRGEAVRARWPLDPSPERLAALLAAHDPAPERATCVHRDPLYGTRSAAILRLGPSLELSELHAAEGAPCRAPWEDRSELLGALVARVR
jgi:hypothetical protein